MEVVGEHFRPEFINRVDDLMVFHPLGREEIRQHRRYPACQPAGNRLADREIGLDAQRGCHGFTG